MIKILRSSTYREMLWKNGLGKTIEIYRYPIDIETPFLWRISAAKVTENGPFSKFEGYNRSISVLEGDGLKLYSSTNKLTSNENVLPVIIKDSIIYDFSGDNNTYCELINNEVKDFNIISKHNIITHNVIRKQTLINDSINNRVVEYNIPNNNNNHMSIFIYVNKGIISISNHCVVKQITQGDSCIIDRPTGSLTNFHVLSSRNEPCDYFVAVINEHY
jgi:environmental stress-induced protein Ves